MEIDLTKLQTDVFQAEADWLGISLEECVARELQEAVRRLYYAQRSRRPKAAKTPENAAVRRLAKELRDIYAKLEAMHGADFKRLFAAQVAELEAFVDAGDVEALEGMKRRQPWQKRS